MEASTRRETRPLLSVRAASLSRFSASRLSYPAGGIPGRVFVCRPPVLSCPLGADPVVCASLPRSFRGRGLVFERASVRVLNRLFL